MGPKVTIFQKKTKTTPKPSRFPMSLSAELAWLGVSSSRGSQRAASWTCRPGRMLVMGAGCLAVLWAQSLEGNLISC